MTKLFGLQLLIVNRQLFIHISELITNTVQMRPAKRVADNMNSLLKRASK